ncbi:Uncharacterised protein [Nocardia africana]|uniref:Uncharacterized protein n=1 Tax=Nocardia africana TaxID=134964 RepID=A0A378WWC3_9NOCA|nr:Uncharacterised protein [Nocardia africana]
MGSSQWGIVDAIANILSAIGLGSLGNVLDDLFDALGSS